MVLPHHADRLRLRESLLRIPDLQKGLNIALDIAYASNATDGCAFANPPLKLRRQSISAFNSSNKQSASRCSISLSWSDNGPGSLRIAFTSVPSTT